jgi:hypothetical protein
MSEAPKGRLPMRAPAAVNALPKQALPAPANAMAPLVDFDIDNPKTTIPMIKQKIEELGLDITEEQVKVAKTKTLLIDLFKEALAKKGASSKPANAALKPTNAALKPANAALKPVNAVPKPANAPVVEGKFDVERAGTGELIKAIYSLGEGDVEKTKALRAAISKCKAGKPCLKKIYNEYSSSTAPKASNKKANNSKLKEAAEEAKAEHQGSPDDEEIKAKAIAAGVAIGMTEDEAEDWLQEPPDGGKRKTRKLPRGRANRTRRR